jgi:hypothetical protein
VDKLKNPVLQQYAIDLLFPLVGYFFLDWSIFIIAIFYLIDQFAVHVTQYIRLYKIGNVQNVDRFRFNLSLKVLFTLVVLVVESVAVIIAIQYIQKVSINSLQEEFMSFAIGELWFFIPLLIGVYVLKDQFTFYMPRRHTQYSFRKYGRFLSLKQITSSVIFLTYCLIVTYLLIPVVWCLVLFALGKLGYDIYVNDVEKKLSFTDK